MARRADRVVGLLRLRLVCSARKRAGRRGSGGHGERAVRPLRVVVADKDAEDVLELAAVEDQQSVQALPSEGADPAFDVVFAFGAVTGVRIARIPTLRRTASKARLNFASRSWTRNRGR
jgi:hypothetical protein